MKSIFSILFFSLLFTHCKEDKNHLKRVLPILGNKDLDYAKGETPDTIYHTINSFQFLNQDSVKIYSKQFEGKIRVASFFFTACPTMCPKMTAQMKRFVARTKDLKDQLQILSFSIDESTDTPSRLRWYIKKNGLDMSFWTMFSGREDLIHPLGTESFLVNALEDDEAPGGYAHSPNFVLVDTEGHVRGLYDGQVTEEVNRLEKDIRKLIKYENPRN
jgi:protein SCO1